MTLGLFEKLCSPTRSSHGSADTVFCYGGPIVALDSWAGVFEGNAHFFREGFLRDKARRWRWSEEPSPTMPRFADTKAPVEKLRARGGKIVFVGFPLSGDLKALEDKTTPRAATWDSSPQANRDARDLLRGFPGAGELHLPRVVTSLRG